MAKII